MSLTGKLLIAMPSMLDQRFQRSVIYICSHTSEGAMGLVVNRPLEQIDMDSLLPQLGLEASEVRQPIRIHFGGPVQTSRGFVLHSTDVMKEESVQLAEDLAITATTDILRAIMRGEGPRQQIFALGYAGWAPGQLDSEIHQNAWLHTDYDPEVLFEPDLDEKWNLALATLKIDPLQLSGAAGHA